jgi:hypothetical protein
MSTSITKRLGIVIWWLGALAGLTAVVMTIAVAAGHGIMNAWPFLIVVGWLMPVCWAACFVLAESFWRPPRA